MKSQFKTIFGWTVAILAIALVTLLRLLVFIIPIAISVLIGIWIYHHV